MSQAPKGGITSQVNGQFYEGGQFTPDHGLFCGKKGEKRKKKVETFVAKGRHFEVEKGTKLFEVAEWYKNGWLQIATVVASTHKEAEECVKVKLSRVTPLSAKEI